MVRVVGGKGGKSREVPITDELLVRLRRFWAAHHNSEWLFPGVGQGWSANTLSRAKAMGAGKKPMSNASVQNAMRMTVASLGWRPVAVANAPSLATPCVIVTQLTC